MLPESHIDALNMDILATLSVFLREACSVPVEVVVADIVEGSYDSVLVVAVESSGLWTEPLVPETLYCFLDCSWVMIDC